MTKTITFAIMHFFIAFSVAYLITGSFIVGGLVALVEPAINTIAYYFHEMIWNRIAQPNGPSIIAKIFQSTGESYALRSM